MPLQWATTTPGRRKANLLKARVIMAGAALVLALAGCDQVKKLPDQITGRKADAEIDGSKAAAGGAPAAITQSRYGTPVKDRVATLGFLNKRNGLSQDLQMKPGESRRIGNAVVRLSVCERTAPWEPHPETGAFVQLYVQERRRNDNNLKWRTIFSGWLFKESPSLNVVEHPVYDVWVKDCAMRFPGEEEDPPKSDASGDNKAAKRAGNGARPAAAAPKPAPKADPAPEPAPEGDEGE